MRSEGKGRPERVDAARIMERIRARVAEKKTSGFYGPDEIEKITRMELNLREKEGYGEEMERILSWLHTHWEATGPVDGEGQAPSSPLKRALKKILLRLLSPFARLLLGKQNQVNARLVQLLSGSIPPLRDGLGDEQVAGVHSGGERLADG